jgi:hypothetical protein
MLRHGGVSVLPGVRGDCPAQGASAADFSKNKNFLTRNPKGFHAVADNLNNGGLQTVSTDKASVTAS